MLPENEDDSLDGREVEEGVGADYAVDADTRTLGSFLLLDAAAAASLVSVSSNSATVAWTASCEEVSVVAPCNDPDANSTNAATAMSFATEDTILSSSACDDERDLYSSGEVSRRRSSAGRSHFLAANSASLMSAAPGTARALPPSFSLLRGSASAASSSRRWHSHNVSFAASAASKRLTMDKLRFRDLPRLYGRDREQQKLSGIWRDVATTTEGERGCSRQLRRSFVSVRGAAGTGKTKLAEALRPEVLEGGGFYLQGKFSQQQRLSRQATAEPYAAFIAACLDLCEHVAAMESGKGDTYQEPFPYRKHFKFSPSDLKRSLEAELGRDASVLVKVIPGLGQLLKFKDSHAGEFDSADSLLEAQHRFKFAFQRFFRVVSSYGSCMIVLDDLQWADSASMDLLEALLSDHASSRLIVIGCYRDDEIYNEMPHLKSVAAINDHAATDQTLQVDAITIGNLNADQVNEMLDDLLSSHSGGTYALAECIHKKTLGNIFFVIQFLTFLEESGLLSFNLGGMKWVFDLTDIKCVTAATENVVGLMCTKMKSFPASIGRALPMMACLGSSFSGHLLDTVARGLQWNNEDSELTRFAADMGVSVDEQQREIASVLLRYCEQQGLIESTRGIGGTQFQWVHDKIQEAAFSMLSADELNNVKLQLGGILYQALSSADMERYLFTVANLLNGDAGVDATVLPRQKPLEVATFFLRTGAKAMENAAFDTAMGYLSAGIRLLPQNHWQDHYRLSLELYSLAAEALFCSGSFEVYRYCHEVIQQENRPLLDKQRVYMVLIDATGAAGKQLEALKLCRDILSQLGINFPLFALKLHVLMGVLKMKRTLKKTSFQGLIAKLPTMDDPSKQWSMAVLDKLLTWAIMCKSELLPLAIFKGLSLTKRHGVSPHSPGMLANVGFLLTVLSDFKGAQLAGDQAMTLLNKVKDSRKVKARVLLVVHSAIRCWLGSIALSIKSLLAGYEAGLATGDIESSCWCIYFYLEYRFRTGARLDAFVVDCAFYAGRLHELQMLKNLQALRYLWQVVLFLTGANSFDGTLTGDVVSEEAELSAASDSSERHHILMSMYRVLMYAQFMLGRHNLVYDSIRKTRMDKGGHEKQAPALAGIYYNYAFSGLSMVCLFRETSDKRYLKLAKKFAAKIRRWSLDGNPNVTHYDSLFDAEFASIKGARYVYSAGKSYDVAIVYAGRRGLTQDRALAHELFGEHLARLGTVQYTEDAVFHLREAIKLYSEWGAHAKVRLLSGKHKAILPPETKIHIDVTCLRVPS